MQVCSLLLSLPSVIDVQYKKHRQTEFILKKISSQQLLKHTKEKNLEPVENKIAGGSASLQLRNN